MKKTTFVALLILTTQCLAGSLTNSLKDIEREWALIHYSIPKKQQEEAYNKLYIKIVDAAKQYPDRAELLIWRAIIKACNADNVSPVNALEYIHDAHDLLQDAIKKDPYALDGSAYVTLGALYYMTPLWPIGFGDEKTAKHLFESAIKINPNGIESNHFYAEFLLSLDKFDEAESYFARALSSPSREDQKYADDQLKKLSRIGLESARMKKKEDSNGLFTTLLKEDILN